MDRTAAIPLPRRAGMVAAGTGLLAGLALGTARRSAAAARRHPPVGRIIEAGGARVHLLDRGRGNPVVFLHGAGGLIEDMALGLLDRAAERYRAVAFDRPGYG